MQRSLGSSLLRRVGSAVFRGTSRAPASASSLRSSGNTWTQRGSNSRPLVRFQHRALAASKAPMFDEKVVMLYGLVNQNLIPMWDRVAATIAEESSGSGTVLDLASGPGNPSLQLAAKYPELKVTCTDASPDMVDKAKALAQQKGLAGRLDFKVLDMQDLSSVETNSFDNVSVCLGFMFPADLKKSVEEVYRVTKPGGTLVATVWRSMDWTNVVREIMGELLGHPPPTPAINPMSLREDEALDAPLREAGFEVKTSEAVDIDFRLGDRDTAWQVFTILNRAMLDEMNESEDVYAKFRELFEPKVETWWEKDGDGGEVLKQPDPGIYRLIVAKKPN